MNKVRFAGGVVGTWLPPNSVARALHEEGAWRPFGGYNYGYHSSSLTAAANVAWALTTWSNVEISPLDALVVLGGGIWYYEGWGFRTNYWGDETFLAGSGSSGIAFAQSGYTFYHYFVKGRPRTWPGFAVAYGMPLAGAATWAAQPATRFSEDRATSLEQALPMNQPTGSDLWDDEPDFLYDLDHVHHAVGFAAGFLYALVRDRL